MAGSKADAVPPNAWSRPRNQRKISMLSIPLFTCFFLRNAIYIFTLLDFIVFLHYWILFCFYIIRFYFVYARVEYKQEKTLT